MSSYDRFMFPEFLPIGLVGRPYGGVKTEPPDVKAEEDLPCRFMFGCLQKGSAKEEGSDLSKAVRGTVTSGRILLAVERYQKGEAWLGRTAELAGIPVGHMPTDFGVESRLEEDDHLQRLKNLQKMW